MGARSASPGVAALLPDRDAVTSKNPQVTVTTATWNGFDLEVFRVPEQAGDLRLLTFNAQVPLKPEVVQVAVVGGTGHEDELRDALKHVLSNLDARKCKPVIVVAKFDRLFRSVADPAQTIVDFDRKPPRRELGAALSCPLFPVFVRRT